MNIIYKYRYNIEYYKNIVVLNFKNINVIAKRKNTSAILFIIIAFNADLLASNLVYQKLINKYEHKPTPSQPTKICKKLSEQTNKIIKM
jgi:hypothetical protein